MRKRIAILLCLTAMLALFSWFAADGSAQETVLTPQNPFSVNVREGSVSFLAEVNAKYFTRSTHHGAVFKGGKLKDKAIFRGLMDPRMLYESLISLGLKPGNNMTMANMEKTFVDGDPLDLFVSWKDAKKVYRFDEVVKDSNGKPILIRFGGNLSEAFKSQTGCLICLESCPVGITSNATYPYGAVEKRKEVALTGSKDLLPPDNSLAVITLKKKK